MADDDILLTLDDHVEARLARTLFKGNPVPVFGYDPDRDKGESVYPSYAFTRFYWQLDTARARPCVEQFTPSVEQETLTFTPVQAKGGPLEVTGPASWTRKPYPTPIYLCYGINTLATVKAHADILELRILQSFPVGYQIRNVIEGQYPLCIVGKPRNLDDLSKPLFRREIILWIYDVWVDRLEEYTVAPIKDPRLEDGIDESNYYQSGG